MEPSPPVSYVVVDPADTAVAPGDSARFRAAAYAEDGTPLPDVVLELRAEPPALGSVDSAGFLHAREEGEGRVFARAPGGEQGFAVVRVTPLTGFEPGHAAFGAVLTLSGSGLEGVDRVLFGEAAGIVRGTSADGRRLETWVPWDAANAPVRLRFEGGREVASRETFLLTGGGDDALEPNDLQLARPVSVPYRNPFLLVGHVDVDHYLVELERPSALTVRVVDREGVSRWGLHIVVQLNLAGGHQEFVGISPAWAFGRNERQDGVVSHSALPPGAYRIRLFAAQEPGAVDRRYELQVDTTATFVLPPDPFEPNDFPLEAPEVDLPFAEDLTLENPWVADYFTISVEERSRVEVRVSTEETAVGAFLFEDDRSVTWLLSNGVRPATFAGVFAPFGEHAFTCVLEPGTYRVGVLENSGSAGHYRLEVDATPTEGTFLNCTLPAGGALEGGGAGPGWGPGAASLPRGLAQGPPR